MKSPTSRRTARPGIFPVRPFVLGHEGEQGEAQAEPETSPTRAPCAARGGRYLDSLAQYRPDLHRYCRRLTGNVWDGEDLMQDTLVRVFSMLGKIDANLENPRAYLIRTAAPISAWR